MNQTIYNLCQKPILGSAMWILGLCSFPPLIASTPVSFNEEKVILVSDFEVKVPLKYFIYLKFGYEPGQLSEARAIIGEYNKEFCLFEKEASEPDPQIPENIVKSIGRPTRIEIAIRSLATEKEILKKVFLSYCSTSQGENSLTRIIANFPLEKGKYNIQIKNLEARSEFAKLSTSIFMAVGSGK
jgi:hypothetical protein